MSQQTTAARTIERAMAGARRRPAFLYFVFVYKNVTRYMLYIYKHYISACWRREKVNHFRDVMDDDDEQNRKTVREPIGKV
jgi:hypothetical protein